MTERRSHQPCFTFTEREKLYDQISHNRFMAIVMQPDMDIHEVKEDSNSFGEYLGCGAGRRGDSAALFDLYDFFNQLATHPAANSTALWLRIALIPVGYLLWR